MSDKKQHKAEQRRRYKLDLWVKEQWYRIFPGVLALLASLYICWQYLSPEQRATNDHIFLRCYLGVLAFIGVVVLCKPRIITSNPKKYFIARVLATGITGGVFAFLLPVAVKSTTTGVGGLRHSILLATGGLIAILTLGETRRKNDNDKDKNDQDKEKNDKDYQRQVRAERRERYTKAIEQLGDEKAPIRTGGVYTLIGLVDEWLEEESISEEERLKEGQVIINNLCAYIRSPFTLASHYDELSKNSPTGSYKDKEQDFYIDKAKLDSEADVRLSIIKEIHNRLQGTEEIPWGTWSDFEYDFSGSMFFYPVDFNNSYYKKYINFSKSTYYKQANFESSTYLDIADFSHSKYYKIRVNFNSSNYHKMVNFSNSYYSGQENNFSKSNYYGSVNFGGSEYGGVTKFTESIYLDRVNFNSALDCYPKQYNVYHRTVNYHSSIFLGTGRESEVYFVQSKYEKSVVFTGSIFLSNTFFQGTYIFSPEFYSEFVSNSNNINKTGTLRRTTLFASPLQDHPDFIYIEINNEQIPDGSEFLNEKQINYLKNQFQEIEKTNKKFLEIKYLKEKIKLSDELQDLTKELHKWRKEVTMVKPENKAAEDTES